MGLSLLKPKNLDRINFYKPVEQEPKKVLTLFSKLFLKTTELNLIFFCSKLDVQGPVSNGMRYVKINSSDDLLLMKEVPITVFSINIHIALGVEQVKISLHLACFWLDLC